MSAQHRVKKLKQVFQLPTSAVNVALPAFAGARRVASRTAAAHAVQQSIDISYPPGPQQQIRRTLL